MSKMKTHQHMKELISIHTNSRTRVQSDPYAINKKYLIFALTLVLVLPAMVYAQTFKDFSNSFIAVIKGFINVLFVSLGVGLAYGVLLYFINADDEKKREALKPYLLWGVIGIAVVFGLWGFVQILCNTVSWCNAGIPYISPPV